MRSSSQVRRMLLPLLFLIATAGPRDNVQASQRPTITIGGVIYTDLLEPVRSGLQGARVTVQGDAGVFEATTGTVIGLWKLDVPEGTYTVTPQKADFTMRHVVRGDLDGQKSITIEVNRENIAANQSIQFLAISWPGGEPEAQAAIPAESHETEAVGGGCATTSGYQGQAAGFFAPYLCYIGVLLAWKRVDSGRRGQK